MSVGANILSIAILVLLIVGDRYWFSRYNRFDAWRDRRKEAERIRMAPQASWLISAPDHKLTGYGKLSVAARTLLAPNYITGLIGAATTPLNDRTTVCEVTFRVLYKHGGEGEETVDIKSERFQELLAVLREE